MSTTAKRYTQHTKTRIKSDRKRHKAQWQERKHSRVVSRADLHAWYLSPAQEPAEPTLA